MKRKGARRARTKERPDTSPRQRRTSNRTAGRPASARVKAPAEKAPPATSEKTSADRKSPGRSGRESSAGASAPADGKPSAKRKTSAKAAASLSAAPPVAASAAPESAPSDALPRARYLFFGGKGGVGKTTAACAAALMLLDAAAEGEQILLFSTDPAHSLSDSLGAEVGDRAVEVARRGAARLFAREMDAARALSEFKTKHRAVLREVADRGTLLDDADINELLDLSLPGMDEVMSLFELSEIDRAANYSRVVVDTAPSGHTSRMLRLPEVFARWTNALDRMADKHRFMVARFVGARARRDEVELFLAELAERIARVRAMLYDARQAAFTLVTIPEAMSVEESARYFDFLRGERVPVTDLLVNRVERERDSCPFCRARAAGQARWLRRIERDFAPLRISRVPLLPDEVRGPAALRRFARLAWQEGDAATGRRGDVEKGGRGDAATKTNSRSAASLTHARPLHALAASARPPVAASPRRRVTSSPPFAVEARRLLIFGGKGGVGKTTAAAAAALALAEQEGGARVLAFSTDPAHSLSDSFDEPIGELKRGVAGLGNLDASEIDPAARFEELKARYRRWTDELFESLTGGSRWEVQFDREAMRELVALAPPGIDEIAALSRISDLLEEGRYTSIVLDTAPTGHLVRFLELPDIALSWVRTFIKLLLKYKNVVRWGGVAEELVALSKSIKRVTALLTDADACEFVGVAIPERMSLEETVRLSETLARLRVPMRRLLVNNLVPARAAEACDFCARRARAQRKSLREFRDRLAPSVRLYLAPQQPHEVHGPARLREHFAAWRAAG